MVGSSNGKSQTMLNIQQIRSCIGSTKKVRLNLKGLGLRRMHQTVQRPDTDQVRGLINKVRHLVEVTNT